MKLTLIPSSVGGGDPYQFLSSTLVNDTIAIDDIASIATVDGGAGDDEIRVGQIYGLPRAPDNVLAEHKAAAE